MEMLKDILGLDSAQDVKNTTDVADAEILFFRHLRI